MTIFADSEQQVTFPSQVVDQGGGVGPFPGNRLISSTAGIDLEDLDDVTITSPTAGQTITYDSNSDIWINSSSGQFDPIGTPNSESLLGYNQGQARPQWQTGIDSSQIPANAISPNQMHDATGATDTRRSGYYPVSAGTSAGDGWHWFDAHGNVSVPAAEGINTSQISNVFRVPATGLHPQNTNQNQNFTGLDTIQTWGFLNDEPTPTTVNFITSTPSTWEEISTEANYNSFLLSNGAGGFSTSTVTPLVDTGDPATCGLVWFRVSDSDWGIFQWPAHSLNQSQTNGLIYTNERNLLRVASQGSPASSMQVGLNIGISPVQVDTALIRTITDPEWFFSADGTYEDGYDYFDRKGLAAGLGNEITKVEQELDAGIGRIPFPEESVNRVIAKKQFDSLTVNSD